MPQCRPRRFTPPLSSRDNAVRIALGRGAGGRKGGNRRGGEDAAPVGPLGLRLDAIGAGGGRSKSAGGAFDEIEALDLPNVKATYYAALKDCIRGGAANRPLISRSNSANG